MGCGSVSGSPSAPASEPAGFSRLHPLTPLVRGWALLVAGAIAVGQQLVRGELDIVGLAVTGGAVMAVGVAAGAVSWWFTRFRIDATELRIESGVFVRRSRRIPLERLQAVDVVQPLVGRLLRLAEVRLEVAGGARSEAALAYLPLAEAHRVRRVLLPASAGARTESAAPGSPGFAAPAPVLVRTTPWLLLAGQLLSSQFLLAVLGFATVDAVLFLAGRFPGLPFLAAELAALGALVVRPFVAEYGFTVSDAPGGLRIQRGLLDLRSSTVLPGRVQGVAVFEPVLWRLMRWVRVEVDVAGQAGSADDSSGDAAATLVPIGSRSVADAAVAEVLPGVVVPAIRATPAPQRARWVSPLGWRYLAAGADDRAVLTRAGWLVRRTDVVPHAKIQSIRVRQGPWQRRLGLADVLIDSPPGPVIAKAKHRPAQSARVFAFTQLARAQLARERARTIGPGA